MTDGTRVPIAKAKGRPMLQWVGKRPLREVRSFPAQLVERFASTAQAGAVSADVDWSGWPDRFGRGGLLFHGDNKEVLAHHLANGFRGKVDLVWRAMVDSVFIDAAFDDGLFNVALADIPERRQDLVVGSYIIERPVNSMRPIAVRITDMLGEEILAIEERAGH